MVLYRYTPVVRQDNGAHSIINSSKKNSPSLNFACVFSAFSCPLCGSLGSMYCCRMSMEAFPLTMHPREPRPAGSCKSIWRKTVKPHAPLILYYIETIIKIFHIFHMSYQVLLTVERKRKKTNKTSIKTSKALIFLRNTFILHPQIPSQ